LNHQTDTMWADVQGTPKKKLK